MVGRHGCAVPQHISLRTAAWRAIKTEGSDCGPIWQATCDCGKTTAKQITRASPTTIINANGSYARRRFGPIRSRGVGWRDRFFGRSKTARPRPAAQPDRQRRSLFATCLSGCRRTHSKPGRNKKVFGLDPATKARRPDRRIAVQPRLRKQLL